MLKTSLSLKRAHHNRTLWYIDIIGICIDIPKIQPFDLYVFDFVKCWMSYVTTTYITYLKPKIILKLFKILCGWTDLEKSISVEELKYIQWKVTEVTLQSIYHLYYHIKYIIHHFLMGRSTHNDKELERLHIRLFHLEHFSHHESSSILRRIEAAILNNFSILTCQIWLSLWSCVANIAMSVKWKAIIILGCAATMQILYPSFCWSKCCN